MEEPLSIPNAQYAWLLSQTIHATRLRVSGLAQLLDIWYRGSNCSGCNFFWTLLLMTGPSSSTHMRPISALRACVSANHEFARSSTFFAFAGKEQNRDMRPIPLCHVRHSSAVRLNTSVPGYPAAVAQLDREPVTGKEQVPAPNSTSALSNLTTLARDFSKASLSLLAFESFSSARCTFSCS